MEEAKRETILDAARRVFSSFGFRKSSISDIAEAAGVAKGTVYLACESKEDLFFQAVMRDLRHFVGALGDLIDPRLPADELLEKLSMRSLEFFDQHPLVRDLFIGAHHLEHPTWVARFEDLRALARANIAELLRIGIRQGRFRADLDVDQTARVLQDFQHAAIIAQSRGMFMSRTEPSERLRAAIQLLMNGLRAR